MTRNNKKEKSDQIKAGILTSKILTTVVASFLKDKHGLFIEVEGKRWLVHNVEDTILIESAEDVDNFQHGLHMRLAESPDGELQAVTPEVPEKKRESVVYVNPERRLLRP